MTWASSSRRAELPRDWPRRRAVVQRNAGGQCQWNENGARCPQPGTDCDHIDRHGGHEFANLQWLCRSHHNLKTASEAQQARPSRKRPTEPHPGLL